jgi:hypothetical protein
MPLSPPQEQIVSLVQQGVTTVSGIAQRLGKSEGIVRAQLTRIKTAGEGHRVSSVQDIAPPSAKPADSGRPRGSGASSNKDVIQQAQDAGEAKYDIPPEMVRQFQHQFGGKTDVHPMVLLGVTIQYVKLVGGRLSAHQCIEQVYEALRVMVGDGSPKVGEEQWTAPWPLDSVEAENEILKQRIADLEKQLGGQPAPEAG